MKKAKLFKIVLIVLVAIIAVRMLLEPKESNSRFKGFNKSDIVKLKSGLADTMMNVDDVAALLSNKKIILAGESHFVIEPQEYFTRLVSKLNDKPAVILLEVSSKSQEDINSYLSTGDEKYLNKAFKEGNNLPLDYIVKWAFNNKERVKKVIAYDQSPFQIILNRVFLNDTRNESMAEAVFSAFKENPDARIYAYGGGMHMLKNGRYRYDSATRETILPRLKKMGVPETVIENIMLSGSKRFPLDTLWQRPGAIKMDSELGRMPYEYFIDYPVFGIKTAGEAYDIFINLGSLTDIVKR